jgi:DNA-binding response OmpR family regulator
MSAKKKNILVADDEPMITEVLSSYLESCGFRVHTAGDGLAAIDIFEKENIALLVLDLMMPGLSGEDVCRAVRRKSRVPIIMLTAKIEEADMLYGLNLGADDYITKPFSLKEIHARIEAVLRRSADDLKPLLLKNSFNNGDLIVDLEKNIIQKAQKPVALTPSELKILSLLMKYPGRVFSRGELIDIALGDDFDGYDRAVDSHIKNLRQKIESNPKTPAYILTVHGMGYRFGGE